MSTTSTVCRIGPPELVDPAVFGGARSRVGDDHVEAAETGDGAVGRCHRPPPDGSRRRASARGLSPPRLCRDPLLEAAIAALRVECELGAFGGELQRDRRARSRRRSAHQDGLPSSRSPWRIVRQQRTCGRGRVAARGCLKSLPGCGRRSLRARGGFVAARLNVLIPVRFRCCSSSARARFRSSPASLRRTFETASNGHPTSSILDGASLPASRAAPRSAAHRPIGTSTAANAAS